MVEHFENIATKYNLLNDFMSLGLHRRWKKHLVGLLEEGLCPDSKVLDLATGTGDVAALFATSVDSDKIYPVDPSLSMMNEGKKKYPFLSQWALAEAESLPFHDDYFSVTTCTFGIRNFRDRPRAFKEIARTLKPNGKFGILEIHPIPRKLRYVPFQLFWKLGVPIWGSVFRHLKAYQYLRDSAAQFISPEVMVEELQPYFDVELKEALIGGGLVTLIIAKKR